MSTDTPEPGDRVMGLLVAASDFEPGGTPGSPVLMPASRNVDDPRATQYEREHAELAAAIHKAMTSSYIGPPRPMLLGDAERAVAAVIAAGWTPPGELPAMEVPGGE